MSYPIAGSSMDAVGKLFRLRASSTTSLHYENEVNRVKADMLHSDPGLEANASYLENFNAAADDDNLIYNRRVMAGLTWNVLDGGFVEHRSDEEILRNQIIINEFLAPTDIKENSYSVNWNLIIYLFNAEKVAILRDRATLIDLLNAEVERLHLSRYTTREDYLKVLSRKAEVDALLRIYADYNAQFGSQGADTLGFKAGELPLLDIRYADVFFGLDTKLRDSISELYLRNLELQHRFLNEVDLNVFARYNYYDMVNPANRSFVSAGFNVSVPIFFQSKKREELIEAKAKQSMFVLNQRFDGRQKELLNECYEYRYKLKQYISFHQKFLLYEELLRRMNATLRLDPLRFNPIEGLILLDDMLAIKMELIDLRQSLYLKLLRIYTKSGKATPAEVCSPFDIPTYLEMDMIAERSGYMWTSTYQKKSVTFIAEYLVYNRFDNLIVSINSDAASTEKTKTLLQAKGMNALRKEAMIGDNELIKGGARAKIEKLLSGFSDTAFAAVHLDVEPHTFADWDTKKAEYLQSYISMLQEVRQLCTERKMELCVSVPLHYPEETMQQVFALCDRVYFMAYENTKPEYIERKLQAYNAFKSKYIIASRTKDFLSRIQLEKYLIDIHTRFNADRLCIHDIGGLMEMDEKTMQR